MFNKLNRINTRVGIVFAVVEMITGITLIAISAIGNHIHNKEIERGLKNGSVIEHNGWYYRVERKIELEGTIR